MLKCFVFVLCAVSLMTIVFCAPGHENIREKQSTHQDVTDQSRTDAASRTRRQTLGNVDLVYIDGTSIDFTKLKDLQSQETSRLAPVNDITNPGQNFQVPSDTNFELVTQNSNYIVYKLKSTGDSLLNGLKDDKKAEASDNQYYNYGSEQYSGYSDVRNSPPPSPPDDREPPPPPPDDREPPPPPPDDREPPPPPHHHPPPPPPPDHHHPPPPHHYPPPPPPPHHYPPPPPPHHHHPPPPPEDYRSSYYDRYRHYDRPPPPRSSYEDRSRRFYDDRQTRQSSYDRPPPPHRGGPQHGGPLPRHGGPPPPHDGGGPRHHHGPPDHGGPPGHHGGPPPGYGGPPRHHGGPPDHYDRRPPPPRDRYDDRPPPRGGPPHHYDDRPPYDRRPPPDDRRPPPHREQTFDRGNENNEYSQNYENSQTTSTTEAATYDSQYQLDIRFSDDEQRTAEAMKRNVNVTTGRPSLPYIFQAAAVTPED